MQNREDEIPFRPAPKKRLSNNYRTYSFLAVSTHENLNCFRSEFTIYKIFRFQNKVKPFLRTHSIERPSSL